MKQLKPVDLSQVTIHDRFWSEKQKLVRDTVIPYQWDALNDNIPGIEPSHTVENFRIAAGEAEGEYYGMVFQDSDLAKWLETVGYSLAVHRDENLEKIADDVIDLIGRAQQSDGYLNTYFQVAHPDRKWTNLRDDHELYCAGHLIEAAVAYYRATGKKKLLDIVCRLVDHIDSVLGREEGKKRGYPGHPEIELALMKLYEVTGDQKHLELCRYFVEERGQSPHYFDIEAQARGDDPSRYWKNYSQAHAPLREQQTADGHSVRAVYLYTGAADLAAETGDRELFEACKRLWKNTVQKRMYVTGGIGSSAHLECFTVDYDLPGDRAYAETCASIGLMFWAQRMQQIEPHREYADVMELALHNGVLSGISMDGKSYFYVNPLEVWPDACNHRHDMKAVKPVRQPWFGCACCPPNIARLLASLGQYVYSVGRDGRELYVHLYVGSRTSLGIGNAKVTLEQDTSAPWEENKKFSLSMSSPETFTIAFRWPSWCRDVKININGESVEASRYLDETGYIRLSREWRDGDEIEVVTAMPVEVVRSHPELRDTAGKVALRRGPLVYCLEEADNGKNLRDIRLSPDASFSVEMSDILGGVPVISATGKRSDLSALTDSSLYVHQEIPAKDAPVRAIPYYAWANRGEGEMLVWIRED